jgi:hypothetical protein
LRDQLAAHTCDDDVLRFFRLDFLKAIRQTHRDVLRLVTFQIFFRFGQRPGADIRGHCRPDSPLLFEPHGQIGVVCADIGHSGPRPDKIRAELKPWIQLK